MSLFWLTVANSPVFFSDTLYAEEKAMDSTNAYIQYDTMCYIYRHLKADASQLTLQHGTENKNKK